MILRDKLKYLKIKLNSMYGDGESLDLANISTLLKEISATKDRIHRNKNRKFKIKNILS